MKRLGKITSLFVLKFFLGEDLELRSRQEIRNSGRFDLTFWDKDRRIVLVEIQLKALDRNHFFRMIEYHKDLRNQGYHDIRIILLCNELNPKRDYLDEYRDQLQLDIEVITIKRNTVEQTILDIDSSVIFSSEPIIKSQHKQIKITPSHYANLEDRFHQADQAEKIIENLNNRVETLRKIAFKDAPIDINRLILKAHHLKDASGISAWNKELYNLIFDKLNVKKFGSREFGSWEEALCPICGEGRGYYGDGSPRGWKLPNGFTMHLRGSHGARQCVVMKAIDNEVNGHFTRLAEKKR